MKNATVTWDLPTVRESGLPMSADSIAGVEVSMSADLGANWAVLNTIAPPTTELLIPDLETGDWQLSLVVIDTDGRRSAAVEYPFNIADDTNPGAVTNVNVTLA
jgi:hypothetical protein